MVFPDPRPPRRSKEKHHEEVPFFREATQSCYEVKNHCLDTLPWVGNEWSKKLKKQNLWYTTRRTQHLPFLPLPLQRVFVVHRNYNHITYVLLDRVEIKSIAGKRTTERVRTFKELLVWGCRAHSTWAGSGNSRKCLWISPCSAWPLIDLPKTQDTHARDDAVPFKIQNNEQYLPRQWDPRKVPNGIQSCVPLQKMGTIVHNNNMLPWPKGKTWKKMLIREVWKSYCTKTVLYATTCPPVIREKWEHTFTHIVSCMRNMPIRESHIHASSRETVNALSKWRYIYVVQHKWEVVLKTYKKIGPILCWSHP